jgi:hypothetical protein
MRVGRPLMRLDCGAFVRAAAGRLAPGDDAVSAGRHCLSLKIPRSAFWNDRLVIRVPKLALGSPVKLTSASGGPS